MLTGLGIAARKEFAVLCCRSDLVSASGILSVGLKSREESL
eukprot:Gb_29308 [translate_table: standard]